MLLLFLICVNVRMVFGRCLTSGCPSDRDHDFRSKRDLDSTGISGPSGSDANDEVDRQTELFRSKRLSDSIYLDRTMRIMSNNRLRKLLRSIRSSTTVQSRPIIFDQSRNINSNLRLKVRVSWIVLI